MKIYLVDGTYELYRHFFALPGAFDDKGQEIAATRGVINSVVSMLEQGASHIGVATDHVIESFRNDLYGGYKTGDGVPPEIMSQIAIVEEALLALGVLVWPMVQFEADDALASAAIKAAALEEVEQVLICTPDKDLCQCVTGSRIVQLDRRRDNSIRDEAGVVEKFGVGPDSIADYLALVGDTADGFPGLPGWGEKGAGIILSQYKHLENIPKDVSQWPVLRGAAKLATTLFDQWDNALLYRQLATLRLDVDVFTNIDELRWQGPTKDFEAICDRLKAKNTLKRVQKLTCPKV
ncbi:MAG: 5'-3' exonuclease H3TH domain-containing protein [Candidatus Obscuribacterales bacterium]